MSIDRSIGTSICFINHTGDSVAKRNGVSFTLAASAGIGVNVEFGAGFSGFNNHSLAVPTDVEIVRIASIVRDFDVRANIGTGCFV